jgi:hypothetical protein
MAKPAPILELHDGDYSFTLFGDASGEWRCAKSRQRWRMNGYATQEYGPIVSDDIAVFYRYERAYAEEYIGHFRGQRLSDGSGRVRFELLGRLDEPKGSFTCRVSLQGPWLEFVIDEVDEHLPSLIFPPAFEAESLVIPTGIGRIIRGPLQARRFHTAFGNLSMRWFGGLRGDNAGWMAIFSEGHTDAGVHVLGLGASPGWLKSMGQWAGPRRVRYCMTRGGYVGMAKVFRQWAQEHGLHRSLRQKLEENPAVQQLLGGRILSFHQAHGTRRESWEGRGVPVPEDIDEKTGRVQVGITHAQGAELVREARRRGMSRGVVNVRGWINGGYDETHPDIWPPEPALGSVEQLRNLLNCPPLVGVLHDNYQDIYRQSASFPRGAAKLSSGELAFGGVWAGGQAFLLCSRHGLEYARRNWQQIRQLQPGGMFIDTTTASPLYECYDPDHPTSRAQDERYKLKLLGLYKSQGQLLGSEETRDFGVPLLDWCENRHQHAAGESIPLWPLVYHDAIVNMRYCRPDGPDPSGRGAPNLLADMLWGYAVDWEVGTLQRWEASREAFVASLQVDRWHGRIALDEMTSHTFIGEDRLVERTEFSSGVAFVANFAGEAREVDGVLVPAGGSKVLE